jgi:hypothetical protein
LTSKDRAAVAASNQALSVAQYDADRDEWRTIVALASVDANGRIVVPIAGSGNYAVVYGDKGVKATHPVAASAGATLQGSGDVCALVTNDCTTPASDLHLDPATVLPSGSTVATLTSDASSAFPSGTAVQAFIDEQLNLADGSTLVDPPFATDLILYRSLGGDAATATFNLSPTTQAAAVTFRDGKDHIRVVEYPGRIARGAQIGAQGGRIAGDDRVSIDVPAGATLEALNASVVSMQAFELALYATNGGALTIPGFRIAGGFNLTLTATTAAGSTPAEAIAAPLLAKAARATYTLQQSQFSGLTQQVVVAEVVTSLSYGTILRLASRMSALNVADGSNAVTYTTRTLDQNEPPVDGLVRAGHYLLLIADQPVAFGWGDVRLGSGGALLVNSRITSSSLGVADLSRGNGRFAVPLLAQPASTATVTARYSGMSDLSASVTAPAADAVVALGTLATQPHTFTLDAITINGHDLTQSIDTLAAIQIEAKFSSAIDPATAAGAFSVQEVSSGTSLSGTLGVAGASITFTPTHAPNANSQYAINIATSLRASDGMPLLRSVVAVFTTSAIPVSGSIHAERIRITIPDSNGVSHISGTADVRCRAPPSRRREHIGTKPYEPHRNEAFPSSMVGLRTPAALLGDLPVHAERGTWRDRGTWWYGLNRGQLRRCYRTIPYSSKRA